MWMGISSTPTGTKLFHFHGGILRKCWQNGQIKLLAQQSWTPYLKFLDLPPGCTTFCWMTFHWYDLASNATFGCCNVSSSVTLGRKKLSAMTFSRKCQTSFLTERHLRINCYASLFSIRLFYDVNMRLTILNCQGAVKLITVLRTQHHLLSEI